MTDEIDYLDLIDQGVDHWNRWRQAHPTVQPDLSRAYLFEADLTGINLSGVNLSRACLIGANLKAANLSGANLQSLYASKANFEGANLSQTDLRQANLSEAHLQDANLSEARAGRTNLSTAVLTGACIEQWRIDTMTDLSDIVCEYVYQAQDRQRRHPDRDLFNAETVKQFFDQQRTAPEPELEPELESLAELEPRPSSPSPAIAPASSRPTATRLSRPTPAVAPPPPPELAAIWTRSLRQFGISQPGWLPDLDRRVIGLGVVTLLAAGFLIRLLAPQQSVPESVTTVGPTVNLASLPCNELPPPDLQGQQPSHVYAKGVQFYGTFRDGAPTDGRGTMVFTNGDRYDGEFIDGQRNGCGTFTFANGRQYMGQFKADQFHGLGIWQLETGERYVGQFEANKCQGWGTFLLLDGSSKSGTWSDGSLVGDDLSCDRGISSQPTETAP